MDKADAFLQWMNNQPGSLQTAPWAEQQAWECGWDAAVREAEALRTEVLRTEVESHRRFLRDVTENMECLPECHGVDHAYGCPVDDPVEAWRMLRTERDKHMARWQLLVNHIAGALNSGLVSGQGDEIVHQAATLVSEVVKERDDAITEMKATRRLLSESAREVTALKVEVARLRAENEEAWKAGAYWQRKYEEDIDTLRAQLAKFDAQYRVAQKRWESDAERLIEANSNLSVLRAQLDTLTRKRSCVDEPPPYGVHFPVWRHSGEYFGEYYCTKWGWSDVIIGKGWTWSYALPLPEQDAPPAPRPTRRTTDRETLSPTRGRVPPLDQDDD